MHNCADLKFLNQNILGVELNKESPNTLSVLLCTVPVDHEQEMVTVLWGYVHSMNVAQ